MTVEQQWDYWRHMLALKSIEQEWTAPPQERAEILPAHIRRMHDWHYAKAQEAKRHG